MLFKHRHRIAFYMCGSSADSININMTTIHLVFSFGVKKKIIREIREVSILNFSLDDGTYKDYAVVLSIFAGNARKYEDC